MEKNFLIHRNVEEALNSVSDIQRADPGPFFYTRLHARLNQKERNIWEKITGIITRPTIAFCSILALVALNSVALFNEFSTRTLPDPSDMVIVEEYNKTISFYDLENSHP